LQVKITLRYIKPPIWRRLLVPDNCTLGTLHGIIQVSTGWSGGHMHGFSVPRRGFGPPLRQFGHEGEDENKTAAREVLSRKGQVLLYEYDFGDGWLHEIRLEKVLTFDPSQSYPMCLGGARACPPDDCGGVPGYYQILEALRKPKVPANEELLEWAGDYDPEAFDVETVNGYLRPRSRRA
jgi:Plasmid pRiA4b ORF-3-like protein